MAAVRTRNYALMALHSEIKKLHLRPVSRMRFQFDPFRPDTLSIRDFLFHISSRRVRKTSDKCVFKTDIVNDRSEPIVNVMLESGTEVIFKTSNLSVHELAQEFNDIVKRFDKSEEPLLLELKGVKSGNKKK